MDTTTLLSVVVVVLLIIIAAGVAWYVTEQRRRGERLRDQFGPEYERTMERIGDRRKAEDELQARAERVRRLRIRPLEPDEQQRFAAEWRAVQARFVDEPAEAVAAADRLVGEVMEARGYPVADFEQRAADVSVDHPQVVEHYRVAHDIAMREKGDGADTEALRQAMVHHRALFADLLGEPATASQRQAEEPTAPETTPTRSAAREAVTSRADSPGPRTPESVAPEPAASEPDQPMSESAEPEPARSGRRT